MSEKSSDIILAENALEAEAWALPVIGSDGNIIRVEKPPSEDELVEDVEEATYQPLTASELEAIRADAQKEGFDKGVQQGLAKGHHEGYQAGFKEAEAKVTQEAQETLQLQVSQLLSIAEELIDPITRQQDQLEDMLVEFVCGLTQQVVGRELITDSGDIKGAVQTALSALPTGPSNITLWLNENDLKVIEEYRDQSGGDWQLKDDPSLLAGGCRIETAQSLVDYSIESRLEELLEQFRHRQLAAPESNASESQAPESPNADDDLISDETIGKKAAGEQTAIEKATDDHPAESSSKLGSGELKSTAKKAGDSDASDSP